MDVSRIDPARRTLMWDLEVYRDYFLSAFLEIKSGRVACFEMFEGQPLDKATCIDLFRRYRIVSFNGNSYDIPMMTAALAGWSCEKLKALSNQIIEHNAKPWEIEDQYNLRIPTEIDHIDLIEPAFGEGSLKLYGGRLHSKRLQDLPIEHDASIAPPDRARLRDYCGNDLWTTNDLFNALAPDLALRERMSVQYGIDLRSKSDAQMAETIIRSRVQRALGRKIYRPEILPGTTFNYRPPAFVQFSSAACQAALAEIVSAQFVVKPSGQPWVPAWGEADGDQGPKGAPIVRINSGVYRMGYGGLHSSETCQAVYTDDQFQIDDDDVASYYPEIKRKLKLAPAHIGEAYLRVYSEIVETRLAAKKAGDKDTAQSLKIAANGAFGKLGSRWSVLYAPDVLIQVTITGQLALLMLIEAFERYGIPVISANTDGVITKCPRALLPLKRRILDRWEQVTGFATETNHYKAVFSRDVNNYLALKFKQNKDGSWDFTQTAGFKGKGAFNDGTTVEAKLAKNPTNIICIDAVRAFLEHGVPLNHTIRTCRDIRKFLTVRRVNGGAIWKGQFLGRVVRWFKAERGGEAIHYKTVKRTKAEKEFFEAWGHYEPKQGAKVATSDNAMVLMTLPDEFPEGVDFNWYVAEAISILKDIGYGS